MDTTESQPSSSSTVGEFELAAQLVEIGKLTQEKANTAAQGLVADGINNTSKLHLVTMEDLRDLGLNKYEARAMREYWTQLASKPGSSQRAQPTLRNLEEAVHSTNHEELPVFTKDSPELFPVREALIKKVRPKSSDRVNMVANVIQSLKLNVAGFERKMVHAVATQIVCAYKESFQDAIPDVKYKNGEGSLHKQLLIKYDNSRRGGEKTAMEKEAPNCKEAYGCYSWNPAMPAMPQESAEVEILEDRRKEMISTFDTVRPAQWDWKIILTKMDETYPLQRKDINSQIPPKSKDKAVQEAWSANVVPTRTLAQRWPFLFQPKGMNAHFKHLTKVNMITDLKEWLQENCLIMQDFLSEKNATCKAIARKMEKAREKELCAEPEFMALFLSIIRFFEEDVNLMFIKVDNAYDMEDLAERVDLPSTPCLLIATENMRWTEYKKVYFAVDQQLITSVPKLWMAVATLFTSYFVLNVQYPKGLGKTMEFFQREIAKINPLCGTRCEKDDCPPKIKKALVKFLNNFKAYKEQRAQEEEDDDAI